MTEAGCTCISCMKREQQQTEQQQQQEQQAQARQEPVQDDPDFYGDDDRRSYYDVDDYRAFDTESSGSEELAADGDLSAS